MGVKYKVFQYRGLSMTGTFHPGDLLVVREIALEDVRSGDVVAFLAPGSNSAANLVVHRVVVCADDGLITRGDACGAPDMARVQADGLVGRVIQAQRGRCVRRVWGGRIGRWWARALRLRRCMLALGRLPYRWLRASGIVRHLWQPAVTRVSLMTARGPMVKYLCGARTVAVWQPETETYWCQKPYDLVLDAPIAIANVHE